MYKSFAGPRWYFQERNNELTEQIRTANANAAIKPVAFGDGLIRDIIGSHSIQIYRWLLPYQELVPALVHALIYKPHMELGRIIV